MHTSIVHIWVSCTYKYSAQLFFRRNFRKNYNDKIVTFF